MYYSEKFRKEVMSYLDVGYSQREVSKMFNISEKTVWNWNKQRKTIGHLRANMSYERSPRKLPKDVLLQYIKDHPDAYLREIADHFGCHPSSVFARLKKFDVSYKKNSTLSRTRRESSARAYF